MKYTHEVILQMDVEEDDGDMGDLKMVLEGKDQYILTMLIMGISRILSDYKEDLLKETLRGIRTTVNDYKEGELRAYSIRNDQLN